MKVSNFCRSICVVISFILNASPFLSLEAESWSYIEFANFTKEKTAFCELGNITIPALQPLSTTSINDATLSEKPLKTGDCTLEQALPTVQMKEHIATGSLRIKNEIFPQISSISATAACHGHQRKVLTSVLPVEAGVKEKFIDSATQNV